MHPHHEWMDVSDNRNVESYNDTDEESVFNVDCNRWPMPSMFNKVRIGPNLAIRFSQPLIKSCSELQSTVIILIGFITASSCFHITDTVVFFSSNKIKTSSEALFYFTVNVLLKHLERRNCLWNCLSIEMNQTAISLLNVAKTEKSLVSSRPDEANENRGSAL